MWYIKNFAISMLLQVTHIQKIWRGGKKIVNFTVSTLFLEGIEDSEKRVKFLQFQCYFSSCVHEKLKKIRISVLLHGLISQGHERTTTTKSHNFTILVLDLGEKKAKLLWFQYHFKLCRPKRYHGKKKQETLLFLNYF